MTFDLVAGFRYVVVDHWYIWLAYSIAVYIGWYFLAYRRAYKVIDSKLYVRYGRVGKWMNVEQHLKEHE